MKSHEFVLAGMVLVVSSSVVIAQGPSTNQVRCEYRLVPQTGLPGMPGGVVSSLATTHEAISGAGAISRFELQYRITDLNPGDQFVPVGLSAADVRVRATGQTAGGYLETALLSRDESGSPGPGSRPVADPANLDTDLSPAAASGARGLHRPFRVGLGGPPPPNNDGIANGRFSADRLTIERVAVLTLGSVGQSDPDGWFGIYSFNYVSGSTPSIGTVSISVDFIRDPATTNAFAFWTEHSPVPVVSPVASDVVTVTIPVVPTPGSATLIFVSSAVPILRRRRRK